MAKKSLEDIAKEIGIETPPTTGQANAETETPQTQDAQEAMPAFYGAEYPNLPVTERTIEISQNVMGVIYIMTKLRDPEEAEEWKKNIDDEEYRAGHIFAVPPWATEDPDKWEKIAQADEEAGNLHMIRNRRFMQSRYVQAISALHGLKGNYPDPNENRGRTTVKSQAVIYFFALHTELRPDEINPPLTVEQLDEVKELFSRLDSFYCTRIGSEPSGERGANGETFYEFMRSETQTKHAKAIGQGALMTIGGRLFVPSDSEYSNAFTTRTNAKAGIFRYSPEDRKKKQLALEVNIPFLQALAKAIQIAMVENGIEAETNIYFPTIARELGYDLRSRPASDGRDKGDEAATVARSEARKEFVHSIIAELDTLWGCLPHDTTEYKLISAHAYNPETEMFTFTSPYIKALLSALFRKRDEKLAAGENYYNWHCDLIHASVASDRNPAAVEMATRLLVGVQQRGLKPDAKLKQNKGKDYTDEDAGIISYHITCKGLIADCPQIREKLKAQPDTRAKIKTLNRAFTAMYRILEKKTDLFDYYCNVKVNKVIPTARSLDAEIIITHTGKNKNYKRPNVPISTD